MSTPTNAINVSLPGLVKFDPILNFTPVTVTQHDVLIGGASNNITSISPNAVGLVLMSNGVGSDPSFQSGGSSFATTYVTNSGNATPALGILNVLGGTNLNTSGSGNSVTANLNTSITLPNTNASLTTGAIILGTTTFMSNYGTNNAFLGGSGNTTLTTGTSTLNTGLGKGALLSLAAGGGNTAVGYNALTTCAAGTVNTAVGQEALAACNSSSSTAVGYFALHTASTGDDNCAFGASALLNSNGRTNCAFGFSSTQANSSGNGNSAFGDSTLFNSASGSNNTAIGNSAGSSLTGTDSLNICIHNTGTSGDNGVIRIGTSASHTTCFVQGISGVTVSNAAPVYMNTSTGQLGTGTPSGIVSWVDVTGTTQTIAVNTGYDSNNAGTVTFALPATATQFSMFRIVGVQGGWTITQAANQQIRVGNLNSTVGVTGSISSSNLGDCVEAIAIVGGASTIWRIISSMGNITVA